MVAKKTTHKQYELTKNITQLPCGTILHRIRAIRDISKDVTAGTLGGWVESEHNLSQNGTSWIYGEAKCYGQGRVSKKAMLYGEASVYGKGYVTDSARVGGTTIIRGCCEIGEDSWLYGSDDYNVLTIKQKRAHANKNHNPLYSGYDEHTVYLPEVR
jgi:hypothetical protein